MKIQSDVWRALIPALTSSLSCSTWAGVDKSKIKHLVSLALTYTVMFYLHFHFNFVPSVPSGI